MMMICFRVVVAAFLMSTCLAGRASAQLADYYIGIDSRTSPASVPAADGGGLYPDNPNLNRLTLLYQHGDHFHGIGVYRYTGSAASPILEDTSSNNRLPEVSVAQPPLVLLAGSGVYLGKNTTQRSIGLEYSNLDVRNVLSLGGKPAGSAEEILLNSSAGRWNKPFAAADIHLELLNVSSPHLKVGTLSNPNALSLGGDVHVGEGEELFSFNPVLWVDAAAPVGNYWAEFRLVDETGAFGNSGRFFLDVQQVPEPGVVGLSVVAVAILAISRRRIA